MEGVRWRTCDYGEVIAIVASFAATRGGAYHSRRICITREQLRKSPDALALVRHAVEQLTLSIRATRQARAQQLAFSELH